MSVGAHISSRDKKVKGSNISSTDNQRKQERVLNSSGVEKIYTLTNIQKSDLYSEVALAKKGNQLSVVIWPKVFLVKATSLFKPFCMWLSVSVCLSARTLTVSRCGN